MSKNPITEVLGASSGEKDRMLLDAASWYFHIKSRIAIIELFAIIWHKLVGKHILNWKLRKFYAEEASRPKVEIEMPQSYHDAVKRLEDSGNDYHSVVDWSWLPDR